MKVSILLFLFVALLSCKPSKVQDPDLVAWWSFDNATQSEVPDQSSNHLNAVNKGAIPVEGKIGKALEFDGNSVLQVDYQPILDSFPKGVTVMAWTKKDTASYWNTIVSREIGSGWSEYVGLAVHQNHALFSIDPDGTNYKNVKDESLIQPGIWYHLAGTFDNDMFKLYINGKMIKSEACKSPLHFQDQNPLLIGGNSNNQNQSLVDCFKGTIDEVRIYKRALSLDEINQLMNLTKE
ncbi:MAG TPA: LamG domain-containing protein [Prolixibacteraceae bacterium]|nr:LamG domain-containing protein [Prolixibacteraceae bacterium]